MPSQHAKRWEYQVRNKNQIRAATATALDKLTGFQPSLEEHDQGRYGHQSNKRNNSSSHGNRKTRRSTTSHQPSTSKAQKYAAIDGNNQHATAKYLKLKPEPAKPAVPSTRQVKGKGKTESQRAQEGIRREYQRKYGGNHSLAEYYQIHRDAVYAEKLAQNEPQHVVHRRGSFAIELPRLPRETNIDRLQAQYQVAMAEQAHYEALGQDPFAFRGHRKGSPERRIAYEEADFVDRYPVVEVGDFAPCFDIPEVPKIPKTPKATKATKSHRHRTSANHKSQAQRPSKMRLFLRCLFAPSKRGKNGNRSNRH